MQWAECANAQCVKLVSPNVAYALAVEAADQTGAFGYLLVVFGCVFACVACCMIAAVVRESK